MARQWQYYIVDDLSGKYKLIATAKTHKECTAKGQKFKEIINDTYRSSGYNFRR